MASNPKSLQGKALETSKDVASNVTPLSDTELCSQCRDILTRLSDTPRCCEDFEDRTSATISRSIQQGCKLCTYVGQLLGTHVTPGWRTQSFVIKPVLKALERNSRSTLQAILSGIILNTHGEKYNTLEYWIWNSQDGRDGHVGEVFIELLPWERKYQTFNTLNAIILTITNIKCILVQQRARDRHRFPSIESSTGTASDSSYNLMTAWLSHCREHHEQCQEPHRVGLDRLPTRLIDIGTQQSGAASCLVEVAELLDGAQVMEYVCLTHRWTPTKPLQLTRASAEQFKMAIPMANLSQTFQDAFTVTRSLGYRYIWIDSLCIIQDSADDWATESSKIGEVYTHAAFTIAATAAGEGSKGLFVECHEGSQPLLALEITRKAKGRTQNYRAFFEDGPRDATGVYCCISELDWTKYISHSVLNQRGWILQERLLSPRTIHFASQLYWECRQMRASQSVPFGFPSFEGRQHLTESPSANLKVWKSQFSHRNTFFDDQVLWKGTVERYSQCDLTRGQDKLPAISGIARKLSSIFKQQDEKSDFYLAGLWQNDLLSQLTWRRRSKGSAAKGHYRSNSSPGCYRGKLPGQFHNHDRNNQLY